MAGLPHKYTGTILAFGERATINAGLTRYLAATGGTSLASELAVVVPLDGKLKNLIWSASASGLTGANHKITVNVNGASTPLGATWSGAALSGRNSTTEVQVLAGDIVSVRIQLTGGGTNISKPRLSLELEMESASPWLADDPNDSDSSVYYVGGGNIGIGTDAPGERLSVEGIIESGTGGFKFPDGTVQTTASAALGGAINALSGPGGTPPDAVYVDDNGRVGIGLGRMPHEKLTLAPDSNVAVEMPAPTGITITPTPGGTLSKGDYFFRVAASDGSEGWPKAQGGTGWTKASNESSITLGGGNSSCLISWPPTKGYPSASGGTTYVPTTYKIYRATTSGGPYESVVVKSDSFLYDSDAGFAPDTIPTETTAYTNKLSAAGPSWVLGGRVGIGTTRPQATLDVLGDIRLQDGKTGLAPAISEFSTDETLSGSSDIAVPTERAVKEYVDNLLAGSVAAFAMELPPVGWLQCDGQALDRTAYARLFARIGTAFGAGDGATTFNLPDLRGQFVRGWSHGSARDPDRDSRVAMGTGGASGDNIGSVQGDSYGSHSHAAYAPLHDVESAASQGWSSTGYSAFRTSDRGRDVAFGFAIAAEGGNETRPKNACLNYCIKF